MDRNCAAFAALTIVVMARACSRAESGGRASANLWIAGIRPRLGRRGGGYPGDMDEYWVAVFWSLLPTVVVSALFFFILRSIMRADRTERRVYARVEAEERAKQGLPPARTRGRAGRAGFLERVIAALRETLGAVEHGVEAVQDGVVLVELSSEPQARQCHGFEVCLGQPDRMRSVDPSRVVQHAGRIAQAGVIPKHCMDIGLARGARVGVILQQLRVGLEKHLRRPT